MVKYKNGVVHSLDYVLHINYNLLSYAIGFMILVIFDQLGLNNTTLYDALGDISDAWTSEHQQSIIGSE
jgi:hypothetical protein